MRYSPSGRARRALTLSLAVLLSQACAQAGTLPTPAPAPAARTQVAVLEPPPAARLAEPAALEGALATISADEIRSDIFFIASDELGGRETPSPGLQIAGLYLRARLQRMGWKPGAQDGYFYTYPLGSERLDLPACSLQVEGERRRLELVLGADYFLSSSRDAFESSVSAGSVWCGAGGDADFAKVQCAGKWAVCEDQEASGFRVLGKANSAGAVGLILVESASPKQSFASRYGRMEELRRGRFEYPPPAPPAPSESGAEARPASERKTRPWVLVGRAGFERALALTGKSAAGLALGQDLGLAWSETRKLDPATTVDVRNVCGFWPGSDAQLAKEVIIVSAHYDHLGTRNGVVNNGADDNGSGTCGLLALAEALQRYGPLRRSVMIMWVSGEEKGLWGSEAWNAHPWLPEGCHAVCDVNIDMIGRNAPDKLLITPTQARKEYNGLVRLAESLSPLEGFPALGNADSYYNRSDHYNFAQKGIPAAFLFSDVHADYHKPTDDPEKIDCDKIRRVVRLVVRMLDGLQADALAL